MKRNNLIRHIKRHGCVFVREGGNHSVFFNLDTNRVSTISRHTEIPAPLGKKFAKIWVFPHPNQNNREVLKNLTFLKKMLNYAK